MSPDHQTKIPFHLAIIPDGNRRWSKENNVDLPHGYAAGADQAEKIMTAVFKSGVHYFTLWAASRDNLIKRSPFEIKILTELSKNKFRELLKSKKLETEEVRMRVLGDGIEMLGDKELSRLRDELEARTEHFTKHYFNFLLGYDGKEEMLRAIEKMRHEKDGVTTYENVKRNLETRDLPPVDLVIRTGGEPHWSAGFLMWHTTDSELYFTEKFWPAFDEKELKLALKDFARRRSLKGK